MRNFRGHVPERLVPAERVRRLRERLGSHDKLAAALRKKGAKATRQTVIRWEKGGGISESYARLLAELAGAKPTAFRPLQVNQQFAGLRQEVLELAEEARLIREEVAAIRRAVEKAGIALPGSP